MAIVEHPRQASSNFSAPADLPEDRRLTVAEAAKAAGLTVSQVWVRINAGKLRAHRIALQPLPPPPPRNKRGKRPFVFVDIRDLEALIEPAAGVQP